MVERTNGSAHRGEDELAGGHELAPGKRTSTSRLAARDLAAVPVPVQLSSAPAPATHDDPYGLHLESASASAGAVQRKDDPAAPPPARKQTKAEKLAEGRWKFAFFFTGGRYGDHAKKYLSTYHPDHKQLDATSFEDMFETLNDEVEKLDRDRDKHDPTLDELEGEDYVEEVVIVSHGTTGGSLMIPLLEGKKRIFTPWDVTDLQRECYEEQHKHFQKERTAALRGITADTRIVVRGCELGDSDAAMHALQTLFGGKPTVYAPRHFQGFQTDVVGKGRLKTWKDAFDYLINGGYIPAELAEATPAQQEAYIREHFPDGQIPGEFFIVSQEDHDALEELAKHDRAAAGGEAGEAYKKRVTVAEEGGREHPNEPYRLNDDDWNTRDARARIDTVYDDPERWPLDALVREAESIPTPYTPADGATLLRLWDAWQVRKRASLLVHDPDHARPKIDTSKIDPSRPLPERPAVFDSESIDLAGQAAASQPAVVLSGDGDAFDDELLAYERPDDATVEEAHDFSRALHHADRVAGPEPAPRAARPDPDKKLRSKNRRLVGDLLAGIDVSARNGLTALEADDLAGAVAHAALAAERTEHLLSITHLPGKVAASLRQFADEAAIAFGHCQELVNRLAGEAGAGALVDALEGIVTGPGIAGHWTWKARDLDDGKKAGKFTRDIETRIGTSTLLMVEHRVAAVAGSRDGEAIANTAAAVTDDLAHATGAIRRAANSDTRRDALADEVRHVARSVRRLDGQAWAAGVGAVPALDAMRAATSELHDAVGLRPATEQLEVMAPTDPGHEQNFLFAISRYTDEEYAVRGVEQSERWPTGDAQLDEYGEKVRTVMRLLFASETPRSGSLARATEIWGQVRHKVNAVMQRAAGRGDTSDAQQVALEQGDQAIGRLDDAVVVSRAHEIVEERLDTVDVDDPESGFYVEVDAAIGKALDHTGELWTRSVKSFAELGADGGTWAGKGASAVYDSFELIDQIWNKGGDMAAKLRRARKEGLGVSTIADLVVYALDVTKNTLELAATGIEKYAGWKAAQSAASSAERATWSEVAEQAAKFEFQDGKLAPGQYLGAALGAVQIVQGLMAFHDAMEKGNQRQMVSAGHTVAQGAAGLAGALLNLGMAAQAMVAGTIFMWWAIIDSMGVVGGMLSQMQRDRKLKAVERLIGEAGKVAQVGREMAAAADAYFDPEPLAPDQLVDLMLRADLEGRMTRRMALLDEGLQVLNYHVVTDDLDLVGGYGDLVTAMGGDAVDKLGGSRDLATPQSLNFDGNTIFSGIDRMARQAMRSAGQ